MLRGVIVAAAAAGILAVTVVEGLRSNRWGPSEDMQAAAARLDRVPAEFGDWVGVDSPLDPKVLQVAEAVGAVSRVYTNRKSGERVTVMLLCGPSGPIGAHTPDVCYGGLGYRCVGKPVARRVNTADGAAGFWTARFEKESTGGDPLRVYWAWGTDGGWAAAENPRSEFALRSVLYKLYVVHPDAKSERAEVNAFLTEFLPLVKAALQ